MGISEANPHLFDPGSTAEGFTTARDQLLALRPRYYRLFVDWSKLQPSRGTPADLASPQDGCLRGAPPCAAYAGVRGQLRALAAAQRAQGGMELVLVVYGVPEWAATPAAGCERTNTAPRSRPITAEGLEGYADLLRNLAAEARSAGVALNWVAPFNEPNHPFFVSPQRDTCSTASPSRAPAVYTSLFRRAQAALQGTGVRYVAAELAGYVSSSTTTTSVQEFVAALPDDVACAASVWGQHNYVRADGTQADAIAALKGALEARSCTREKPIWVTETGVGGSRSSVDDDAARAALARQCAAMAAQLREWSDDPRVHAAFQYTFREDTAFRVGLADSGLTRTFPVYDLWRAFGRAAPGDPVPDASSCG